MTYLSRSGILWLVALALGLLTSASAFGAQPPLDPSQYPALAKDRAFQHWWWFYQQRAHPLGHIPHGARQRAHQQIEQSKAGRPHPLKQAQGPAWTNIGPAPLLGGQIGATGNTRPMSGRVTAIAVHPRDPNHRLIGAAQGGVWETTDSGNTWVPKTDGQASLAVGAIAYAPSDPNTIYAAMGEANFSADSYVGEGVLKSTDGGATWQLLAPDVFHSSSAIRVGPTNSTIVLVAATEGAAGRSGGTIDDVHGIFTSTDGGSTWVKKLNGQATALEVDPRDFRRQLTGIGNPLSPFPFRLCDDPIQGRNGLYRSMDAGETWMLVNGPWEALPSACFNFGRVELAIAPSNPNVAYVSIQQALIPFGGGGNLLGLWKTYDAWADTPFWFLVPVGQTDDGSGNYGYCGWDLAFNQASPQCHYSHKIIVDPAFQEILYAGGIPLWKLAGSTWIGEVSHTTTD